MRTIPSSGNRFRNSSRSVLHGFALFEASKGLLVLTVGLGLLALVHRDIQIEAEDVVRFLHLNPAHHFPRIFLDTAAHVENSRLWLLSLAALAYSTARFVEAGGLWFDRPWAEWFAIASDAMYIPVEIYEVISRVTVIRTLTLLLNIAIVAYLLAVITSRWKPHHRENATKQA